jgi:mitochondrial fission protein ELM1
VPPRVWVLLGRAAGGNGQLLSLAGALGWPYETRRIVHNPLQALPNAVLGASTLSLDRRRSDALGPPWPDLVLAAGRRSAPVARWIRARSGGRARLVHLLHAQLPLDRFDLVITLPQYRLPQRPNVLVLSGALNRIAPERLEAAAGRWRARFAALPRPWAALIVGGDSSSYRLDPETAARLGREASDEVRPLGGSLLVSTTPRTPPAAADALFAAIDVPRFEYRWRPDDPENPYLAILALADRFIVTVDSASLPMEACATGRPVQVFEWPRRGGARAAAPLGPLRRRLAWWGLIKPARDFDLYHRALREQGLTTRLGQGVRRPEAPPPDLERAVARVRALLPGAAGEIEPILAESR